MDITNKTRGALSVPLPGGKKLFLGPGKTGQISDKAMAHPPVVKLLEAGELVSSGGTKKAQAGETKSSPSGGSRHGGTGAMRQSGDR